MDLQIFSFEQAGNIRGGIIDGEPAVCAKDVAVALGYKNTADAISKHCKGVAIHYPLQTAGGKQDVRFIREPDLYRLIMRANTLDAERFQDWVCETVLPQIRKTGTFQPDMPQSLPDALEAYAKTLRQKEKAEAKLIAQTPKVEYYDRLADTDNLHTTTAIAKRLKMGAPTLNKLLNALGIIYKTSDGWMPYAQHQNKEGTHFKFVVATYTRSGGNEGSSQSLKWTERGAQWIMKRVSDWLQDKAPDESDL